MKTLIFVEDIVEAQELVLKIKKKVIKNNDLLIITLNPNIQSYKISSSIMLEAFFMEYRINSQCIKKT